jgi:hypothetical protein
MGMDENPLDKLLKFTDFTAKEQVKAMGILDAANFLPASDLTIGDDKVLVINRAIIENFEGVQNQVDALISSGFKIVIEMGEADDAVRGAFLSRHGLSRYLDDSVALIGDFGDLKDIAFVSKSGGINADNVVYVGVGEKNGMKELRQLVTDRECIKNNPMFPVISFAGAVLGKKDIDPFMKYVQRAGNILTLKIEKIPISDDFRKWLKQETIFAVTA